MIQSNPVAFIPKLDYTPYAWGELTSLRNIKEVEDRSEFMSVLTSDGVPLFVVGVISYSFLTVPRFWFLMCKGFEQNVYYNLRGLRQIVPTLTEMYPKLETLVLDDWSTGMKFARFCGFRPTARQEVVKNRIFRVMEL